MTHDLTQKAQDCWSWFVAHSFIPTLNTLTSKPDAMWQSLGKVRVLECYPSGLAQAPCLPVTRTLPLTYIIEPNFCYEIP